MVSGRGELPQALPDASKETGLEQYVEGISRRHFISSLGILLLAGCGSGGDMPPDTSVAGTGATPATPAPAAAPSIPATAGTTPVASTTPETTPETPATPASTAFVHPGLLHTQADFDRMSQKVNAKAAPWIDGWNILIANGHASLNYKPNPQTEVYRGNDGVHGQNYSLLYNDVAAAYACALRWKISGDELYAKKAVTILNDWSKLTVIGGDTNAALAAGLYGYEFANAAEIMRSYSGWAAADLASFQNMMRTVFYRINHDFLIRHNGTEATHYWANWDLCNMASIMAIGVLCDDRAMFNEAVEYFKNGIGNGAVSQAVYYVHPGYLGQWQETGRDQGHNTLGIALMGPICEMAWNQGVDLYGYDNNRFLAGAEYVAKANLIESGSTFYTVPYVTYNNVDRVNQTAFATGSQGLARPGWVLVYNHYVNRKGLAAPYCQKFTGRSELKPEGGGGNYGPNSGGYDQLGYGTLTCTRDPIASGMAPSGLTAIASQGQVMLSWWGSAYASSYSVQRGTVAGGSYTTVATGISDLLTYTDSGLAPGTYYYVVTAQTPSGTSAASNEASAITAVQLLAYLALDDGSGATAADASGKGHPATLTGGASWASGKKGGAVSLNGSNGYLSLPAGMMSDVGDVTVAAWVFWNGNGKWARIFDFGSGTGKYMMLTARNGNGFPRFAMTVNGGSGEQGIDSSTALTVGQWVHVAVTLSGKVGTLYLDGNPVGSNSAMFLAPFRLGSGSQNWIGRSQFDSDPYFNGLIDEFRIYRGALSATQIAALM
ncbi:MAG: concanavalin A-like lectin/glucanase superfamily protein [Collimonas fungivorans]|uniref:LamG-like jellyroll fold domain-containing protein n=1 Tax=Collimonas fungivorans TaxID=158899 RepID=UPI0026EF5EDF|nr:LamG-like jellyroll fold domain-containing protein [Collimonas fungivorans]MDB5769087.1 concanavalin A-like lectin/glucanase superfamily protein [Collimonas fungivorans]